MVLAETRPAQWVTLHNISACFIREMWFVDCSCIQWSEVATRLNAVFLRIICGILLQP